MAYRVLQLTNPAVGAVATGALLPLGAVTRKLCCTNGCSSTTTFNISTTGTNTITLNETGYYRITLNTTLVAGAVGLVTLSLLQDGVVVETVSQTATAVGDSENITLTYVVRVYPNCAVMMNSPSQIQVSNTGVALTGGTSNIIVEKVH